jgi:GNAT superfamily N-acetyltransferase
MEILRAEPADAPAILAIVHAAFGPVAAEYGAETLPPLEETLADLLDDFRTHVVLKAVEGGRIVGSVRGVLFRGTCEVGRLVVDPGFQGRGVGKALAAEIERCFADAERFELFTGHRSGPSLHIYAGLGYVPFRIEPVSDELQLVYLEKTGSPRQGSGNIRRR